MNYYAWKMRAPRYQCFSHQMNSGQPWQLKKSRPFWSYQLVPIQPIYLKDGPNCSGCQSFILAEIHYSRTLKSWHNNSFLSGLSNDQSISEQFESNYDQTVHSFYNEEDGIATAENFFNSSKSVLLGNIFLTNVQFWNHFLYQSKKARTKKK